MKHQESKTQIACVNWFNYQYRVISALFFAVPNGGRRNKVEAGILKAEGTKAGVSDLLLLLPSGEFNFLAIEMKTESGKQNANQKLWQKEVESLGAKYAICRNIPEFQETVNNYLRNTKFGVKKF